MNIVLFSNIGCDEAEKGHMLILEQDQRPASLRVLGLWGDYSVGCTTVSIVARATSKLSHWMNAVC